MADLVGFTKPDGGTLHPMEIISSHSMGTCDQFAQVLLNAPLDVNRLRSKNKETEDFIHAVLSKWVASVGGPAVECTWSNLLECMSRVGMNGVAIEEIREAIPSSGVKRPTIHVYTCTCKGM